LYLDVVYSVYIDTWRVGVCADTFWTNPQYRVMVVDADEGDADNTGTLIVALLQKERRLKRTEGAELLTMGYAIYKVVMLNIRSST